MYSVEERSFISYMLDKNNSIQNGNVAKDQHSQETHRWKIRLKEDELAKWLQNCNSHYLFSTEHQSQTLELLEQGE